MGHAFGGVASQSRHVPQMGSHPAEQLLAEQLLDAEHLLAEQLLTKQLLDAEQLLDEDSIRTQNTLCICLCREIKNSHKR